MLEAIIEAEKMREMIDIVSSIVSEAKFIMDKKGLVVTAVDEAHVLLVEAKLGKKAFVKLKVDKFEFGIDIDKLKSIFTLASGEVKITSDGKRLKLEYNNVEREMSLLSPEAMSSPKIPDLTFTMNAKIKRNEIDVGVKTLNNIGETVEIKAKKDYFEMFASDHSDTAKVILNKDSIEEIECKEEISSMYSLDYFMNLMKFVGKEMQIQMADAYPMRINFKIADEEGDVTYVLAPRVTEEE